MVVVIPVVVGMWYANSKQYGENNIKYDRPTHPFFPLPQNNASTYQSKSLHH